MSLHAFQQALANQQPLSAQVTCGAGLEPALLAELNKLGFNPELLGTGRIKLLASFNELQRLCLHSRVASRVLLELQTLELKEASSEQLYESCATLDWDKLFSAQETFAVRLKTDSKSELNSQFGTLKIKDAVADQFTAATGSRPDVSKTPMRLIQAELKGVSLQLFLDLTGSSLHKRGQRTLSAKAPLKENLAAGVLFLSGYPLTPQSVVFDPMCGSGTLLLEAYQICTNQPAGKDQDFAFMHWAEFQSEHWATLVDQALSQVVPFKGALIGYDYDPKSLAAAHQNLTQVTTGLSLEQRALYQWPENLADTLGPESLLITNPPYGERLGSVDTTRSLYQGLGHRMQQINFAGQVSVLALTSEDADRLPLEATSTHKLANGPLSILLRTGTLKPKSQPLISSYQSSGAEPASAELAGRLKKNLKHLRKTAKKESLSCLRIYDADLPNYNCAVDLYDNWVHIQEYSAPKKIDPEKAKANFKEATQTVREQLGVNREQVFLKVRSKSKGGSQYQTKAGSDAKPAKFYSVQEANAWCWVNFTDYLDTGLFLDHRPLRSWVYQASKGKDVLNLFAYTSVISLQAALGGAKRVTSVDLSATYLNWGRRNFALSGVPEDESRYNFIESDVFEWIKTNTQSFDLIVIDPPTFSNSKKFKGTFDVQRDHAALINRAMNRLNSGGVLYFSNNYRSFTLDPQLTQRYHVEDVSAQSIGEDFKRRANIHCCFKLSHKSL